MSKLVVKGKNIDVTDALRDHVTKKLSKLDKYSQHIVEVVVELQVEKNPRISDNNIVLVNVFANGAVIRAEEASPDMYASVDMVLDKVERQLKKYERTKFKTNKGGKQKTSEAIAAMSNIDNESYEDVPEKNDEQYLMY